MIYLRARYYDPTSGRFTTQDPAKDGLNWYSYCANNPISYTDPTGLTITVNGTDAFKNQVKTDLEMLSGYKINIDDKGNVSLGKKIKNNKYGYKLISRMIEDDDTTTIEVTSGISSTVNKNDLAASSIIAGSSASIQYNPHAKVSVLTMDPSNNNNAKKETMPSYLVLGHELCHADRAMRGVFVKEGTMNYKYKDSQGVYQNDTARIEEVFTTGFIRRSADDITENLLRVDQGLMPRIKY